jgi:hypothetical protein
MLAGPQTNYRIRLMPKLLLAVAFIVLTNGIIVGDDDQVPKHLADARELVKQLHLADTNYEHGKGEVIWKDKVEAHCDCSGLLNNLLMHSYGYTEDDLATWLGAKRPTARRYHEAIADQNNKRFTRITNIKDVRPGDIFAVKYAVRSSDNTGHVMLVDAAPKEIKEDRKEVEGAVKQWQVRIIDSSMSAHGSTDTRYEKGAKHSGVGRGLLRVYTNAEGEIVAYTWSTESAKTIYHQKSYSLVIGRLVKD